MNEKKIERVTDVEKLREQLQFLWRWISRLNGDKEHDRPELRWKEYVSMMVNYPAAPYETGDWFEDYLLDGPRSTTLSANDISDQNNK